MAQMAEEIDRMARRITIPDQSAFAAELAIRKVPLACQTHQPTGNDLAAGHSVSVSRDRAGEHFPARTRPTFFCHDLENPQTGQPFQLVLPCGSVSGSMGSGRTRFRFDASGPDTCWPLPETDSG